MEAGAQEAQEAQRPPLPRPLGPPPPRIALTRLEWDS